MHRWRSSNGRKANRTANPDKNKAPHAEWTHCFIHREALVSKELSEDLHEVLNNIVKAVNFIKTRPMKARFFQQLCHDLGAEHDAMLFHNETRWLSRGNVLSRVFGLREEMRQFLEQENQTALADLFGQEDLKNNWLTCQTFSAG